MNDKTSVVSVLVHAAIFAVVLMFICRYYKSSEGFQNTASMNTMTPSTSQQSSAKKTQASTTNSVIAPPSVTTSPTPSAAADPKEMARDEILKAIQGLKL
jgi:hypothetical protein